ncbi:MAG: hypothetical protein QOJ39_3715 [Candidatus Eremiobacteraeota bacterium]|jgi:hypothetical protein|nr:hypothetical protein [Candidatus Eremiobacteraeota bacterium]
MGPGRTPSKSARMQIVRAAGALSAVLGMLGACSAAAKDVSVPSSCNAAVNAQLARLIDEHDGGPIDNVMVCGTTFGPSRSQRAGAHGGHQLIPLRAPIAGGRSALVEVVTNDGLDGRVTAPRGAHVAAYGQYFLTSDRQRPFVAGIHEVHCATHRGADNGWVVVNGVKYPQRSCGF